MDPNWLNNESIGVDSVAAADWPHVAPYLPDTYPEAGNEPVLPELPLALDPKHVARRLSVQRAHFTVFGRNATRSAHSAGDLTHDSADLSSGAH